MSAPSNGSAVPLEILLVEDSPDDVLLVQEALRDGKVLNALNVGGDGEEAMDYLYARGPYAARLRPDVILLDLNLPKKDGREVLEEVKADDDLRRIPVIVLTTSADETDIRLAYDHFVNAYVTKPVGLDGFLAAMRSFEDFWLTLVRLPPR
jgi:chemotaxis family two-component system response regulator Rcp1